ncbi:hypothetical protein [Maridesulfovibrio sp.]|uniref:hypothetical protein n=1 Tax=Maridesulfovibrio sp. TaxID=2795000 RepID=UPI0029F4B589|nr:hypothetical protein [Maridesulfovibrio sp.]
MTGAGVLVECSLCGGGSWDGEHCEHCGCGGKLDTLQVKVSFGKKKVVRNARLCRKCIKHMELETFGLSQENGINRIDRKQREAYQLQ